MELAQMIVLKIPQRIMEGSWLSVPGWEKLKLTNGLCRDRIRASQDIKFTSLGLKLPYRSYDEKSCLLPYYRHLEILDLKSDDLWLIIGMRNLGNNLRIIGWNRSKGLLELNSENATFGREYCCLCKAEDGRLSINRVSFVNGMPNKEGLIWAGSGQELVWEGKPAHIENIIPYTYDLRHVWQIPGKMAYKMGPHANRGALIEEMCDEFVSVMDSTPSEVTRRLINLARAQGYERESNYLHSALGISEDGETLIVVQRHGKFEDIAETLIRAGAYRAIELDQGGSCSIIMGGSKDFNRGRIISSGHYFRPSGLSFLVFTVEELTFIENSTLL